MATLLLCLVCVGAQPAERVTVDNIEAALAKYLQKLPDRIDAAKRGAVRKDAPRPMLWVPRSGRYIFRTVQDRDREIARLIVEKSLPTPPAMRQPVTGQIGSLTESGTAYHILQVIGDKDAIIVAETEGMQDWWFWLRSPIARQMRDDQRYDALPGCYVGAGPKRYGTAAGSTRTVDLLEEYDLAPHVANILKTMEKK